MTPDEAVSVLSEFGRYIDERITGPAVGEIVGAIARAEKPKPKKFWEMFGDYLREAAVLVLVFVPVDLLIPQLKMNQPVDKQWLLRLFVTLAVSLGLLILGMLAEQRKK